MLFENNLPFTEWLDWFYEDLPIIQNKTLSFIGKHSNNEYSIYNIPCNAIVTWDNNKNIFIDSDEPILIKFKTKTLSNLVKNILKHNYDDYITNKLSLSGNYVKYEEI